MTGHISNFELHLIVKSDGIVFADVQMSVLLLRAGHCEELAPLVEPVVLRVIIMSTFPSHTCWSF
jgi:hypothetical protein